ncbi:hypothetical protein D3C75_634810 [compost metagenome]
MTEGKVTLTPERLEKIRMVYGQVGSLTGKMCQELLDALEEAQQTIVRLESELEEMTEDRNIWRSNSDWDGDES